MIDIVCYKGNIIHVRRSDELTYPMKNNDYVLKILSILELTAHW